MKRTVGLAICGVLVAIAVVSSACSDPEDDARAEVVEALDALASEVRDNPPSDVDGYYELLNEYLEEHTDFFGAAAAMVDESGNVIASPYVFRGDDGLVRKDLHTAEYDVAAQPWFSEPFQSGVAVWSEPYFDEGGGDIRMVTRSVPVEGGDGVFVVLTTDLPVEAP